MREFIIRTLPRLFAVLGCSTLVTACYGTPYDYYHADISGRVLDSETAEPVKGINVKMTLGYRSQTGDNSVQSLVPVDSPRSSMTDVNGKFSEVISTDMEPDGVLIECYDIDGPQNGTYLPNAKVYSLEEAASVEIRLEKE